MHRLGPSISLMYVHFSSLLHRVAFVFAAVPVRNAARRVTALHLTTTLLPGDVGFVKAALMSPPAAGGWGQYLEDAAPGSRCLHCGS